MKTNNYFQPQTCVERTIPQVVMQFGGVGVVSHVTEDLPFNPQTPSGDGLG